MKTSFSTSFLLAVVAAAALAQAAPQEQPSADVAAAPSSSGVDVAAASAVPSAPAAAAAGAGAAAGAAQAGPVSVTQPIEGASWKIGGSEQVAWTNVKEGVDKLIINLMNGDASALTFVQTLASEIDAKANNTTVEVPANVTAGDYSLAIGADESNMAYIGGLKIEEGDGADASSKTSEEGAGETTTTEESPAPEQPAATEEQPAATEEQPEAASAPVKRAEGEEQGTVHSIVESAVAHATSAVVGAPSAAESGAAEATSAVAGAPSAAQSGAAEITSTSQGKFASATDKVGSAAGAATSKVGSAAAAATSKVGGNSADSGALRNLASGFALALPAAVLAMVGF